MRGPCGYVVMSSNGKKASYLCVCVLIVLRIFFFKDTATTEIYTLSLHDALPILCGSDKQPN